MTAEEAALIMMSGGGGVIKSLTVTQNGEYRAPDGIDGYNPVIVDVPDRYDEGYKDGYKDGHDAGYDEGYEDGYNKGYEDGKGNGEYTFPEGTEYEDIIGFIGDDTVVDKTLGYGVSTIYEISESDPTRISIVAVVVDSNGNRIANIRGTNAPVKDDWRIDNIHVYSDGWCEFTWSYLKNDGTRGTTTNRGYSIYLKGFGESGHTIGVSNA